MAYDSNKAPGRDADQTDTTDFNAPSKTASNQERMTGTGARRQMVSTGNEDAPTFKGKQRVVGNQVKMSANPYGSDTLKNPLNTYKRRDYPAVSNPDPVKNRTGNNKAPGRKPNGGVGI